MGGGGGGGGVPTEAEPTGLYDDPMVYDILHAPGTAGDVDGLERIAGRFGLDRSGSGGSGSGGSGSGGSGRGGVWLEPACGTARHLRVALARGAEVIGFDNDPAMIAYARRRMGPPGRWRLSVGDMRDFVRAGVCGAGRVGLAFNLINSIRHLMDDAAMAAHLEQVAEALAPGGVYVVGLSTTMYGMEQPSEDVWTAARGRCRVTQVVQYEPPEGADGGDRIERVHSHLMIERPGGTEHVNGRYGLRTWSLGEWMGAIGASGLGLVGVCDESGEDMEPTETGYRLYVLRRD